MPGKQPSIAKISRPIVAAAYPRRRLYKLIDKSRSQPVIWIAGPGGSGKTTLASSYISEHKLPCLWYRLDSLDGDLATFFYYLGLAGKNAAPRKRTPLPLLTTEYLLGIPTFSRNFFENLYSRLKVPFTIVFDNYQTVPADSHFHEIINIGLSNIPEGINIILISRSEPSPSLAQMRANRQMQYIGWNDIRLDLNESKGITRVIRNNKMPGKFIEQIHNAAQGWAAGLVLMLEKADLIDYKKDIPFDNEEIFEYFATEIFKQTDKEIQNFLLKTALLPIFTHKMAKDITGQARISYIIKELTGRNYFIEKNSGHEASYRYHPLFNKFLLARARVSIPETELAIYESNAARILEKAGCLEDAADLYIQSGNHEGLIDFIMKHARALVLQGRNIILEKWLKSLPDDIREKNPWLLFWMGSCCFLFNPMDALHLYEKAFKLFRDKEDPAGILLSWSGIIEANTHGFMIISAKRINHWTTLLNKLIDGGLPFPSIEIETRVTTCMLIALLFSEERNEEILKWTEKAEDLLRKPLDTRSEIMLASHLATYYSWQGDIPSFSILLKRFSPFKGYDRIEPTWRLLLRALEGIYGWQTYSLDMCRRSVSEALNIIDETGINIWKVFTLGNGATACLSEGNLKAAEKYLDEMASNMKAPLEMGHYYHLAAWHAALNDNIDRAFEHLETCLEVMRNTAYPFVRAIVTLDLAGLLIEKGDYDRAKELMGKALAASLKIKSMHLEFRYYLAETLFLLQTGKKEEATAALGKTMHLARKHEIVNTLFWRPAVMSRLCVMALENGIEVEFVRKLIRMRNLIPAFRAAYIEEWPWPVRIYTLGRFGIVADGKDLMHSSTSQKKPLEMLKALIALGGRDVSTGQLSDVLWPDSDGDTAMQSFKTTLHRLRKLIKNENAIYITDGKVSLDNRYCWVDAWALERCLGEAGKAWDSGKRRDREYAAEISEMIMHKYCGTFLCNEDGAGWALSMRERLRDKRLRNLMLTGKYREERKEYEKAVECYLKALDIESFSEGFYQALMKCYDKLGRKAEALAVYERCEKTLMSVFKIEPSEETKSIYLKILK